MRGSCIASDRSRFVCWGSAAEGAGARGHLQKGRAGRISQSSTVGDDKESPEPGEGSPGGADEVSGSGGEDGCSLRASHPSVGRRGAGMLEVGSTRNSLGGPVGSTDWIRTGGTSREAYLST